MISFIFHYLSKMKSIPRVHSITTFTIFIDGHEVSEIQVNYEALMKRYILSSVP